MKNTQFVTVHGQHFNVDSLTSRKEAEWLQWGAERFFVGDKDQTQKLKDVWAAGNPKKEEKVLPPKEKDKQ